MRIADHAQTRARARLQSLRDYLELLESHGQLVRWVEPVRPEPDLRRLAAAASRDRERGPAVLVSNIEGYPDARVALNVHGSFANLAVLMRQPRDGSVRSLFDMLAARWQATGGELRRVPLDEAAIGERRIVGDVNLYSLLPLFRLNPYDGGFYIAKASTVSRDPEDPDDFGRQNVGIYRVQVHGPRTISVMSGPNHDIARHIRAAEAAGLPLRIAVMIGNHPSLTLFGGTPIGYDESEYEYAAAVGGDPLTLTTTPAGLDVLADSEVVLEAELVPGERVPEGPFGEFPGTYTGINACPLFNVTSVLAREHPIFENIWLGPRWGEVDTLVGLNTSVPIYAQLHAEYPEVVAVNALYQHGLTAIISVRNRFGGFAKSIAMRALGSGHGLMYLKNIILVDEDVDPFDLERVLWSLSTRTRVDDIIVLPSMPQVPLDPSALVRGKGHRLVIDATRFVAPDVPGRGRMIDDPPKHELLRERLDAMRQGLR